jgi:hypothetical protein
VEQVLPRNVCVRGEGQVAQIMYTQVSKCKYNKIKSKEKKRVSSKGGRKRVTSTFVHINTAHQKLGLISCFLS